jgi:hypothetical protein
MHDHHSIPAGQNSAPDTAQEPKRVISDRKLAANRLNAQRSTGPRTPQGKENSKRNSYKLGIFAQQLFQPTEQGRKDWEEYKDLISGIYSHYQPHGVMEERLVDKVVTETVRFARTLNFERRELDFKHAFWNPPLDKILRYQTAIDRQLTKALEQLEGLQAKRKAEPAKSDPSDDLGPSCAVWPPWLTPQAGGSDSLHVPSELDPGDEAGLDTPARQLTSMAGEESLEEDEIPEVAVRAIGNYKTNPPSAFTDDEDEGTAYKGERRTQQNQSLVGIIEGSISPSTSDQPDDDLEPTSDSGTELHDAMMQGADEEDEI